jgi:hypothetical protein
VSNSPSLNVLFTGLFTFERQPWIGTILIELIANLISDGIVDRGEEEEREAEREEEEEESK